MSKLFGLARTASEYLRNRFRENVRKADAAVEARGGGSGRLGSLANYLFRRGVPRNGRREPPQRPSEPPPKPPPNFPQESMFPGFPPPIPPEGPPDESPTPPPLPGEGNRPAGPQAKPWQTPGAKPYQPGYRQPPEPPSPPGAPPGTPGGDDGDGYDDIQLLGRDAGYHEDDFFAIMDSSQRTPGSSNVYSFYFERESRRTGILYVTFKRTLKGGEKSDSPGTTYAYYDIPVKKAVEFRKMAAATAGGAVWDYLRIRGTMWGHQHQYRLVHAHGEYVPRKASPKGFVNRAVPALGAGRRSYRRNTLPAVRFNNNGGPDRGGPNRGEPDRGN